jgi:hypothetical protein
MLALIRLFMALSVLSTPLYASADTHHLESSEKKIIRIDTIDQLPLRQPEGTLFLFDLDDTLIDSPHMVGSRAWRQYMRTAAGKYWHDRLSLFLVEHIEVAPVEEATATIVKILQSQGHSVCGFTARERHFWFDIPAQMDKITVGQVNSVGIFFNSEMASTFYPELTSVPEYYEGIFFSNVVAKGSYLTNLLQSIPPSSSLPRKIVFIDDKWYQVESVAAALERGGIDYECYWYRATDKKESEFDPIIANIQLYHIWVTEGRSVLTDQEAAALMPTLLDHDSYLKTVIEEAEGKLEVVHRDLEVTVNF